MEPKSTTSPDAAPASLDPRTLYLHRTPKRDVPYLPTDEPVVPSMLRLAELNGDDVLYDLGCGDGRIVIAAAKLYGCHAVGVDIDPLRIHESRENARKAGVESRVRFLCESFFDIDVSPATVMTLYLLPSINVKLRPKLLFELRPGTRIIANYFDMGEWPPDKLLEVHHRKLLKWIVPAWAGGRWNCILNPRSGRQRMILRLERHYQFVSGTAQIGRRQLPLISGRLVGEEFTFWLPDPDHRGLAIRFACRIVGKVLRGSYWAEADANSAFAFGGLLADHT